MSRPSRIPAKLYWNPVNPDSTTEADWGTYLGDFDNLVYYIGRESVPIVDQIWGGQVEELITLQKVWVSVLIRDIRNKECLKLIFSEVTTNDTVSETPTLDPKVSQDSELGGKRLSANAGVLFIRPRDPDEYLATKLFNAIATIGVDAAMEMEIEKDWGFPIVFKGLVDSDGKTFNMANVKSVG